MDLLRKDKLLLLILTLAFLLRIIGLTPNFLQHPDEPGVIEPASKILVNTVLHGNPDPNVEPHPFKYASTVFYLHSIVRGLVLIPSYALYKTTGYTFSLSKEKFGSPNFEQFLKELGPYALPEILLWFHRLPSAIFGTLTVILVHKISLLLFKKKGIALLSSLALAVMPHHVRDSHYATVTIIQTFFFLLTFFWSAKIWQNANTRNYFWAGLSAGFATSIKYFPISILPLIFFIFLVRKRLTFKPIFITVSAIFLGYLIGMPYTFAHFQKMIDFYRFMADLYAPDQITTSQSIFALLLPSYIHGYHLQFFFKSGVGPILTMIGIFGIIFGLKTWRIMSLSLLVIPIINLLFISFYLEAVYDTLMVPALPFFAIFIGVGSFWLIIKLGKRLPKEVVLASFLLVILFPTFINSLQASIACTKTITEREAHDWISKNIPEGAKLAFQPNMRMPSKDFEFIRSEPKTAFLLSEIQESGARYIALHSGYTDRYPQWLEDNIFLPKYIKDNEFTHLTLQDFGQNAKLLESFTRPEMCTSSRIYIYEVPKILTPAENVTKEYDFKSHSSLLDWELGKLGIPSGSSVEYSQEQSAVKYSFKPDILEQQLSSPLQKYMSLPPSFYGTPLRSPLVEVTSGKKYSAKIIAKKISKSERDIPDGFLRLDFYNSGGDEPILTRLSTRLELENDEWQKLTATAYAPPNTHSATISFQTSVATIPSEYLIEKAELLVD